MSDHVDIFAKNEANKKHEEPANNTDHFNMILDVPVTLSVEIGKTKMNIRDLLGLNRGSVVELDRFASESLDVKVNGVLVAHGEVVIIDDKFAIKLTDIVSTTERVKNIK